MGSRCRALPIALIALVAATLVHHVHNARFLAEYPNMPGWLSAAAVYGAWLLAALFGVAGYLLLRAGYRRSGALLLAAYGCYGLDALLHYVIAPPSAHSFAMHSTIALEALAGAFLLVVIARRRYG
jgi:hypothetical protein